MIASREIDALFQLIDDPDAEVYSTVSHRIVEFGKGIIPNLENLWENTLNPDVQIRIEQLIHRLHFQDLTNDFTNWKKGSQDLLEGALLVARYHYPELDKGNVLKELERIRRSIWLELSQYLTPLEQANVFSSILFNYHKLRGVETGYEHPEEFLFNKTLESKKGNGISNGIIYLVLAELLDVPVKAVRIPKQFILAHMEQQYDLSGETPQIANRILFYIDPLNGQIYSQKDVDAYFNRMNIPPAPAYFRVQNSKSIIIQLLQEFGKCFDNELNQYKLDELRQLQELLES